MVAHRKRPPYRRGAFHMRPQGGSRLWGVGDAAPYSHPHSACRSKRLPLRGGKNAPFSTARCDRWPHTGNARHTVGAHSICARKGAAACGASGTPPPTATRTVHASPPYRRGAFHMRPQGGSRLRGVGDAAPYSHPHSVCRSKNSLREGKNALFFAGRSKLHKIFFKNFKNATFQGLEKMICYTRLCYTD